jgi:lipopolysaccharide transport system ATP-binding protein
MKPILEIQGISKKFRIKHEFQEPYLSLRDAITTVFKKKTSTEEFWALKDITFNVLQGESIGIIGKNGAGKSTLLKILSKITPPTQGKIISRGRIASLLEVGTGFHPELTGRENVFLNGSILGMKRNEITNKFDEIVDFSGVEKFLDTPLKHYSSGMQLRLAFAVAAFLEPEILVIDEVLSVGDAEFQKKCLGKMGEISKNGSRSILFVSHNLSAVQLLCNNSVYLKKGEIVSIGQSQDIIKKYLDESIANSNIEVSKSYKEVFVEKAILTKSTSNLTSIFLSLKISALHEKKIAIDFRIYNINGTPAGFASLGTFSESEMLLMKEGTNNIDVSLETQKMANGLYYLSIDLTYPDKEYFDRVEQVIYFEVANPPKENCSRVLLQEWNYGSYTVPVNKI